MPYVTQRFESFQYSGTGGEAFVAQFTNLVFDSEAAGVVQCHFESAGIFPVTINPGDWVLRNGYGQFSGTTPATEYEAVYIEIEEAP